MKRTRKNGITYWIAYYEVPTTVNADGWDELEFENRSWDTLDTTCTEVEPTTENVEGFNLWKVNQTTGEIKLLDQWKKS